MIYPVQEAWLCFMYCVLTERSHCIQTECTTGETCNRVWPLGITSPLTVRFFMIYLGPHMYQFQKKCLLKLNLALPKPWCGNGVYTIKIYYRWSSKTFYKQSIGNSIKLCYDFTQYCLHFNIDLANNFWSFTPLSCHFWILHLQLLGDLEFAYFDRKISDQSISNF